MQDIRWKAEWKTNLTNSTKISMMKFKEKNLKKSYVEKKKEEEKEELKQYEQSVNDVLKSWSQKNLTAKQLQVVLAIMEELNVR